MEADNKLFEIWKQFQFDLDPINTETEKEKFLKDVSYNPQFEYKKEENLDQFRKNLQNLNIDNSWIGKLIKERGELTLRKIDMLTNKNPENFTENSIEVFGKPNKKLISLAYEQLKLKDEFEIKNLSYKDAKGILIRSLKEHKLLNWKVQIREDMVATAKVDTAERVVYIKKDEKFSISGIERLIIHELQSHAFRMENSIKQKYKLFQVGFPNYLETEEGLAAFNEEMVEYLLYNKINRIYAGRVVAVNLALEKSFSEVFSELSKYFVEEDAWILTTRVKRGLLDTSMLGGFTKDYIYFSGKIRVKEFLRKNSGENLRRLYIGRIGIEHVGTILSEFPNEISKPFFLPKYNSENSKA